MEYGNPENLKELFEKFMDSHEAQRASDDIRAGDQILQKYPAPEPDEMLIANIKAEISLNALSRKRRIFKHTAYKLLATAAAIIIITAISINLYNEQGDSYEYEGPLITAEISFGGGTRLADLTSKLEQIEDEKYKLDYGEQDTYYGESIFEELEYRFAEIQGNSLLDG